MLHACCYIFPYYVYVENWNEHAHIKSLRMDSFIFVRTRQGGMCACECALSNMKERKEGKLMNRIKVVSIWLHHFNSKSYSKLNDTRQTLTYVSFYSRDQFSTQRHCVVRNVFQFDAFDDFAISVSPLYLMVPCDNACLSNEKAKN